mgnify:CR=1 FL=1
MPITFVKSSPISFLLLSAKAIIFFAITGNSLIMFIVSEGSVLNYKAHFLKDSRTHT